MVLCRKNVQSLVEKKVKIGCSGGKNFSITYPDLAFKYNNNNK